MKIKFLPLIPLLTIYTHLMIASHINAPETYHYRLSKADRLSNTFIWEKNHLPPFNEVIVSWNADRPQKGEYSIFLSIKTDKGWSPFMQYAEWSKNDQKTFMEKSEELGITLYQDTLEIIPHHHATGFQVKILAKNGANLTKVASLHTCLTKQENRQHHENFSSNKDFDLPVQPLSQFGLNVEHCHRLCSPTATVAVLNFLTYNQNIDPIKFSSQVLDSNFDIYGNWVLNVAQAYHELGSKWECWVQRCFGLQDLLIFLVNKTPVVISIRGPIAGSPLPYQEGHLIAVTGYDSSTNEFLCMDPGFPPEKISIVRYKATELEKAWERRGYVSYVFSKTP